MVYSKTEVEKVIKTLPISYYAFKEMSVRLTDEDRTYINLATYAINISYPMIRKAMEDAERKGVEMDTESVCRALLYHEVSHALLTPMDMKNNPAYYNVFEDERIETLLYNYYINVDFKANVKHICGWDKPHEPRNADEAFFQTVRFRYGKPEHLKRVKWIIERYSMINTSRGHANGETLGNYEDSIKKLYEDIVKDFEEEEKKKKKNEEEEKGEEEKEERTTDKCPSYDEKEIARNLVQNAVDKINNGFGVGEAVSTFSREKQAIQKKFANDYYDYFYPLFYGYNKRSSGGSALQAYSGVLNPRNAARDDYRYFDRMAQEKGNNRYGSMNLNLFIDTSGSFRPHQPQVNGLLEALERLENRFKFFTFELITCNVGEQLKRHDERRISCVGGNWLDESVVPIWRKVQKLNTPNYNIVLFDGDAYTDPHIINTAAAPMTVFDYSNVTLITDPSNEDKAKKCRRAKVVISNNYTEELERYVKRAVQFALS